MLYTLVVLAGVFNYVFAAPLSSCLRQADCIDSTITELDDLDDDGNVQYEICLVFDATLDDCVKDESDSISHACVAGEDGIVTEEDGEKLEGLSSGSDGLCDTVPCGVYTTFGLKDGPSCELDGPSLYANLSIPDYDYPLICYSGLSCSSNPKNKNAKACKWAIRAPDCPEETSTAAPDTTTEAPDTTTEAPVTTAAQDTTTAAPDTTTEAPDTTVADTDAPTTTNEGCVCRQSDLSVPGYEAAVDPDECVLRCDGTCEVAGENNCVAPRDPPPSYAVMYTRRRTTNDLVPVDEDTIVDNETTESTTDPNTETDPDTNPDTNPDINPETNLDNPTEETISNKAGIIGLSMVGLLSMIASYLLQ